MKKFLIATGFALAALGAQAADVGVSISLGQPGFYGRIDIGNVQPQLVYAQPVLIQRVPAPPPPIYLRVPPGHERNWRRYCGRYDACGRPVYFVRDNWYREVYAPQYRREHERRGDGWRDDRHDDRRDDHRGHGRGPDRHDDRRGDDHGRGHGRD